MGLSGHNPRDTECPNNVYVIDKIAWSLALASAHLYQLPSVWLGSSNFSLYSLPPYRGPPVLVWLLSRSMTTPLANQKKHVSWESYFSLSSTGNPTPT
jgi:hypothetical protein